MAIILPGRFRRERCYGTPYITYTRVTQINQTFGGCVTARYASYTHVLTIIVKQSYAVWDGTFIGFGLSERHPSLINVLSLKVFNKCAYIFLIFVCFAIFLLVFRGFPFVMLIRHVFWSTIFYEFWIEKKKSEMLYDSLGKVVSIEIHYWHKIGD